MNDNTNKITDWLKQHGADSVEPTQEGYHCTTYLFGYTIQERTVVSLMKHDGTNKPLSPIPSAITDIGRPLDC
jgi:hypothetical protein